MYLYQVRNSHFRHDVVRRWSLLWGQTSRRLLTKIANYFWLGAFPGGIFCGQTEVLFCLRQAGFPSSITSSQLFSTFKTYLKSFCFLVLSLSLSCRPCPFLKGDSILVLTVAMSTLTKSALTHYFLKKNPIKCVEISLKGCSQRIDMYFLKPANFFEISRLGMKVAVDDMKLF